MRVLLQSFVAGLHEPEDALDDEEGMLDLGAHAGVDFVLRPFLPIYGIFVTVATVGEIRGLRYVLADDLA